MKIYSYPKKDAMNADEIAKKFRKLYAYDYAKGRMSLTPFGSGEINELRKEARNYLTSFDSDETDKDRVCEVIKSFLSMPSNKIFLVDEYFRNYSYDSISEFMDLLKEDGSLSEFMDFLKKDDLALDSCETKDDFSEQDSENLKKASDALDIAIMKINTVIGCLAAVKAPIDKTKRMADELGHIATNLSYAIESDRKNEIKYGKESKVTHL